MSLLYAVEAWVVSVLFWGWISARALLPARPFLDEACCYSSLLVSSVHLVACSGMPKTSEAVKAFLGFTLTTWTLYAYAVVDSLTLWRLGQNLATNCCVNLDVARMNRALFFGDLELFLVPSGVTFAFLSVLVLVSGAGLVSQEATVWPGDGWGYAVAFCLSALYAARFYGLQGPMCPDGVFFSLFGFEMSYGFVFSTFCATLLFMMLVDGVALDGFLKIVFRIFGLAAIGLFCACVWVASQDRGMLTLAVLFLLAKAFMPALWGVVEPLLSPAKDNPEPAPVQSRRTQRRARWVMPIQPQMRSAGEALPCPLYMQPAMEHEKLC